MALSIIVYASTQIIITFHNTIEHVVMFMTSYNVRSWLLLQHHVLFVTNVVTAITKHQTISH